MNFEDSDGKCDGLRPEFCYWNNWIPKNDSIYTEHVSKISEQNLIAQGEINKSRAIPMETGDEATPSFLGKTNVRNEIKLIQKKGRDSWRQENFNNTTNGGVSSCNESISKMSYFSSHRKDTLKCDDSEEEFNMNKDWGKRIELHNILHVCEGEKLWNIISRGIFAEVKLWTNEYGNICCKASGKISVKGASEKSLIEINTVDNLRKMLNLSSMQWSALCEAIQEKNCCLSFNALNEVDVGKMSRLEKLWFFICKRRHFLPNICVLGKLSGAVKLLKELRIIPKLVVIDIRDFKGEEIS